MFAQDYFYQHRVLKDHTNNLSNNQSSKPKVKSLLAKIDEQHNSEDQGIQDYKIGGYHPVHIGQVLINRYVVIQKLGWGHFSTVWLCKDFKFKTYVAIKIQKSSPNYMEAAFDQVQILQKIESMSQTKEWKGKSRDENHVVGLLNAFIHKTVYGNHFCMVFQILRCNLLDIIKKYNYQGVPLQICQEISKQVLIGLDYLHRVCGVIHTDLKPENVMIGLTKQELEEIVTNGQLNKKELFVERIKLFRGVMGIPQDEDQIECDENAKLKGLQQKLMNENLSKNQKKNLKKKIKKQKLKSGEENALVPQVQKNKNIKAEKTQISLKYKIDDLLDVKKGRIQINNDGKLKLPLIVKIGDLGNACWKHHHFSTQIQTRQYRSPQIILGQSYNETADMWSFACMMYEMLTGDLLFQPRKTEEWSKNDDHLAQMQQLLGPFDLNFISRSPKMKKYFNKNGTMKRFPNLNHYSLATVLQIKNKINKNEAKRFADFLIPMLRAQPQNRMKANQALRHPWINIDRFQQPYKMSLQQHQILKQQFCQDETIFRTQIQIKHKDQASCEDNINTQFSQYSFEKKINPNYKLADIRYIDRSFTDLGYIGYCDGIDFDRLDSCTNWQFK